MNGMLYRTALRYHGVNRTLAQRTITSAWLIQSGGGIFLCGGEVFRLTTAHCPQETSRALYPLSSDTCHKSVNRNISMI